MAEPLCKFSDRLYLTTFPDPAPSPSSLNRNPSDPTNRPRVRGASLRAGTSLDDGDNASYYYFMIDHQLLYAAFFQDWGPLNIAMLYKACILIHELLEDKELTQHRLVLYTSNDPRRKANVALIAALYSMIVLRNPPWEAFRPISELEFMPFRDAGRGPADFNLNIQDCLWGMWKAIQNGLCDMNEFDVEDYEFYEKVENGDWNWISPKFIAFASPLDPVWVKKEREANEKGCSQSTSSRPPGESALQRRLPIPFQNCLDYFVKRNVKLVVRLNTRLYDRNTFLDRGIDHMELYFDDGTNPTDEIVRTFLDTADRVIESGGVVAVHCKAGLGRTGTLIGAYLIWKYGFTASEAIAFMRIVRPGSVVGPQQQYMYLKQLEWCKWSAADEIRRNQTTTVETTVTTTIVTPATPPAETDDEGPRMLTPPPTTHALPPVTPSKHIASAAAHAKAIATPGQPRKTPKGKRAAVDSDSEDAEEADDVLSELDPPLTRGRATNSRVAAATKGPLAKGSLSEQRPTRATRSTNPLGRPKPAAPIAKPAGQGPNKIPRLNATKTAGAAKAAAAQQTQTGMTTRRAAAAPQTPSRLPTLVTNKRTAALSTLAEVANATIVKKGGNNSDAWMTTNVAAVVVPANKTQRPSLRNVRRRRSSFSSVDVVA